MDGINSLNHNICCRSVESFDTGVPCPGYIRMSYEGQSHLIMLDSGCDVSIFPAKIINRQDLEPFVRNTVAANGSAIKILGQTVIELEAEGMIFLARVLVSPNVLEPMLSRQWLRFNCIHWPYEQDWIEVRGRRLPLETRQAAPTIRRVVVEERTVLPPLSQTEVSARVELSSLSTNHDTAWMTEVMVCRPGACVARAVIGEVCNGLPLLVMNVTDKPISLEPGMVLSNLTPVECAAPTEPVRNDSKLNEAIELIVGKVDKSVTASEKESLRQVLYKYADVISLNEFDIGLTPLVEHEIDTGDAKPVKQALRRQPFVYLPKIDAHVEQMVKAGWATPVSSPWSMNLVCVKKGDESLRMCTDLRAVNSLTKKDSYRLPNITTCLETLSGAKYFTSMDLANAFLQIPIKAADQEKTTFITRTGTYAYTRMCFGLCNASATFSRLMDLVMKGLHYSVLVLYLDDVVIFSSTAMDMIQKIEIVLQRLQLAKLKVKPSKCHLLQTEITFLGFVINEKGVSTCPSKIAEVVEWPAPTNGHEIKSFLGLTGYYRKFIKNYSEIVAPLNRLTSSSVKFEWTEDCKLAFETLKKRLTEAPILSLPRSECMYVLDTDASQVALGAVLSQVQDGVEKVISFNSRTLNAAERNYCTTRAELLSVVHFLKKYRCYLLGAKFLLRTDHAALTFLQKTPELHGQQARWLEVTQEFNFDIQHRAGIKHGNADALSRKPCKQCKFGEVEDEAAMTAAITTRGTQANEQTTIKTVSPDAFSSGESEEISRAQIQAASAADPDLNEFMKTFDENKEGRVEWKEMLACSPLQKTLWTQWNRLKCEDGILYREWYHSDGFHKNWQTIVPASLQNTVLTLAHKGLRGHFGEARTKQQLQGRAYWPGWAKDTEHFCHACTECVRFTQGKPRKQGLLQSMQVGAPFERLSVDLTGPHPRSSRGHTYILTIMCHFSKWGDAFPLRNKEAVTVARVLVDQFFTKYAGLGLSILTDQGKEFCNTLLSEICKMFQVDKLRTSAYRASTNGCVERWHRTLNSMIGKVVADNHKDWDDHLPFLLCAYRSAHHESTGFLPNMLILGRELMAPIDLVCGQPESTKETYMSASEFVQKRKEKLEKAFQIVRSHLKTSIDRNKAYYDMRVRPATFEIGHFVWYYCPRKYQNRSPKWQKYYTGPFLVIKILGPNSYLIQKGFKSIPLVVHVDKLKAYLGAPLPSWVPTQPVEVQTNNVYINCVRIKNVMDCVDVVHCCRMERGWKRGSRYVVRQRGRPYGRPCYYAPAARGYGSQRYRDWDVPPSNLAPLQHDRRTGGAPRLPPSASGWTHTPDRRRPISPPAVIRVNTTVEEQGDTQGHATADPNPAPIRISGREPGMTYARGKDDDAKQGAVVANVPLPLNLSWDTRMVVTVQTNQVEADTGAESDPIGEATTRGRRKRILSSSSSSSDSSSGSCSGSSNAHGSDGESVLTADVALGEAPVVTIAQPSEEQLEAVREADRAALAPPAVRAALIGQLAQAAFDVIEAHAELHLPLWTPEIPESLLNGRFAREEVTAFWAVIGRLLELHRQNLDELARSRQAVAARLLERANRRQLE